MFSNCRKNSALEQAQGTASDVADRLSPAIDRARDKAKLQVSDARVKAAPYIADARVKAAPYIAEAQKKAAPVIEDVRERTAPVIEDVRERFQKDVLPTVTAAASAASEKAAPYREEAQRRGQNAAAALRGEDLPKQKSSKLGKVLVVAGLGGLAAVAVKMLQGPKSSPWQEAYTPSPAPVANPAADQPVGTPVADTSQGAVVDPGAPQTADAGDSSKPPAPGEPTV